MKKPSILCVILVAFFFSNVFSQGKNHNWLIGYNISQGIPQVTSTKARLLYNSNSLSIIPETRKMPFIATQGNISDENGNLIIVSNGCWIANATGDTMLNGGGLNPGYLTSQWCDNTSGMPMSHGNLVLPFPGDTTKYILFHQIETVLYYSLIDITLDGGLGGVVQKNIPVIQDSLNWGITACKHANGRDWWIVALKQNSNLIYNVLLTPDTTFSITTQILNFPFIYDNAGQPTFSPDGHKFAYTYGYGGPNGVHDVRILNFDRCTGVYDSLSYIPLGAGAGFGLAFSPNSNYLYHSSFNKIYQVNLSTFSQDTVAVNDGFYSPYPPFQTDFWLMYLAANGKIYISSGNSVIDLHVINSPDSAGIACDIQLHSLHTPCFTGRGNVNHPNYYLGPVIGSVCDSLTNTHEIVHDFKYSISPNPNPGKFNILYLLPQNQKGRLNIYDVNGKSIYEMNLPPWSTMQNISLPTTIADGIYNCVVSSENSMVNKKLVVIRN